jgi:formyltetrahydrofolate deformylase
MPQWILRVSCADRRGLVAGLTDFVFRHAGNVLDLDQHTDTESGRFFMRLAWDAEGFELQDEPLAKGIEFLASRFAFDFHELHRTDRRDRVAVFCGKEPHCVYDLLQRHQLGELGGDIALLLSNHPTLGGAAAHFGLPFFHVPVESGEKLRAEAEQNRILNEHGVGLVVMAKYMQILSPEFVNRWAGRVINIHHSFLPAFKGARPYHQAKSRGVKLIGATAHYATGDLDEGPIIEQDAVRVSHRDTTEDLVRKGRDVERRVLARAVQNHLERRVIVEGNRTIVFG